MKPTPLSAKLAAHADLLAYYYTKICARIELNGQAPGLDDAHKYTRKDRQLRYTHGADRNTGCTIATFIDPYAGEEYLRVVRLTAWLYDALAWAIEEYREGRPVFAFRAYRQALRYVGELKGCSAWSEDVVCADAIAMLHNAIEATIEGEG